MAEPTDNSDARPDGLLHSLRRVVRTLAATVHNRCELLFVELQEEGIRFLGCLLLAGAVLLLSGLALIVGMFAVLLAVGEEHRLLAAIIMTATLLAAAAGTALWLVTKLKNWSAFTGTREELRKDREWLQSNNSES